MVWSLPISGLTAKSLCFLFGAPALTHLPRALCTCCSLIWGCPCGPLPPLIQLSKKGYLLRQVITAYHETASLVAIALLVLPFFVDHYLPSQYKCVCVCVCIYV